MSCHCGRCIVVALGVGADRRKHPLGLWEGTTANKTVCNVLLSNPIERGLSIEQPWLLDAQPALDRVAEQHVADRLVRGRAFPQTKRMLAPVGTDAQGDHDTPAAVARHQAGAAIA